MISKNLEGIAISTTKKLKGKSMRKYLKLEIFIPFILFVVILIYLTFVLFGANIIIIGASDNGRTLKIAKGQTIRVSLDTNPTTGFEWHDVQKPKTSVLQLNKHFLKTENNSLPGSPSVECWEYKWSGAGSTGIKLQYNRSWEKDVPPIKTFHIKVIGK